MTGEVLVRSVSIGAESEAIRGGWIDAPREKVGYPAEAVPFEGWVVGRAGRAVFVELTSRGVVLRRFPVRLPRADVTAARPELAAECFCGFRSELDLRETDPGHLAVETVFEDGSRSPLAAIDFVSSESRAGFLRRRLVRPRRRRSSGATPPVGRVRFGDLDRLTPLSRRWGLDRGQPLDRYYIEGFLAAHAEDIRGVVLEVGDDSYSRLYGGAKIEKQDLLDAVPNLRATIVADLSNAPEIPSDRYDCIVMTQTFQYIYDVRAAAATVHRILKPGGVLLATFSGISPTNDANWGDSWYWNLTPVSAKRVFTGAFGDGAVLVESFGNPLVAAAFLYGMAHEEIRRDRLDHVEPGYAISIAVRAVKGARGRG